MDIKNVTQFVNFVSDGELSKLDGMLLQTIQCVNTYSHACNCHKREDKERIYTVCNKLYYDSVRHVVPRYKNEFLARTSERQIAFYSETGVLIGIVSR